ncbi:ABC transporter permease subunit [Helicobacter sp. 23-1045]
MGEFWYHFRRKKLAFFSAILFCVIFIVSLFAPFIANDRAILIYKDSRFYFPIFVDYVESDFVDLRPLDSRESVLDSNESKLDSRKSSYESSVDSHESNAIFEFGIDYKDPHFMELLGNAIVINPPIPYRYDTIIYDLSAPPPNSINSGSPNTKNLLGTDDKGRDLFARLLYGVRISLIFGLILSSMSSAIGIFVGALQGFYGGRVDIITQRLVEIWASVPILFALIIISSFIVPTFWRVLFIVLLFSWISLVGLVRAEFLRVRNFDFVKASRALGASDFSIAFRHILPNALISTTTYFPFILAGSIATLTTLDFLGFGLPAEYASLGEILNQGKDNLNAPHIGIIGFLSVSILLSLLVFIGEGVRDSLNPKHSRANGSENAI